MSTLTITRPPRVPTAVVLALLVGLVLGVGLTIAVMAARGRDADAGPSARLLRAVTMSMSSANPDGLIVSGLSSDRLDVLAALGDGLGGDVLGSMHSPPLAGVSRVDWAWFDAQGTPAVALVRAVAIAGDLGWTPPPSPTTLTTAPGAQARLLCAPPGSEPGQLYLVAFSIDERTTVSATAGSAPPIGIDPCGSGAPAR